MHVLDRITHPISTIVDRSINFLDNKGFKTSKSIRDAWEKKKAAQTQKPNNEKPLNNVQSPNNGL